MCVAPLRPWVQTTHCYVTLISTLISFMIGVPGLHYSFQSPSKLYFVLDYVNGGELYFHLNRERKFSVERSIFYAAELTSALGFLHGLNILYVHS